MSAISSYDQGVVPIERAPLLVDFGRYFLDLVVFVGITGVLMCSFHLFVLWHKKQKYSKLSRPDSRALPGRDAGARPDPARI
ncbi:hypothetical protein [Arthrobacter alkaliphilus]|uniref:hypothetical protein n=1 Tax=Arthrobacter alkaliphilus TaxID=369936 RepID=UPI001F21EC57|nr:hypothetical protein [Arthrobacter alkaliphilus]